MKRLRDWFTRWRRDRRIRAAKQNAAPLREFIYLDEISVYSLLTSRQGALATEYTDTLQHTTRSEMSSKVASDAVFAKAELAGKMESSQAQTSQVVRKSTVQAAFKELIEGEEDRLAVRPIEAGKTAPEIDTWAELVKRQDDSLLEGWLISPKKLRRGQLVDLQITLSADSIFRMATMIDSITQIISETPELFPPAAYSQVHEVAAISKVLDRLLVGLVPLRCEVADYEVASIKDQELIVHKELLKRLGHREYSVASTKPLHIVGVVEQRLFWKDVRRVLFSGSRFRAMCRLNSDGFAEQWVPVKLVDVLKDILPDLAQEIDDFGNFDLVSSRSPSGSAEDDQATVGRLKALVSYGAALAGVHGKTLTEAELLGMNQQLSALLPEFDDIRKRRAAFNEITKRVAGDQFTDPLVLAQLRADALLSAGLGLDGSSTTRRPTRRPPARLKQAQRAQLDAEFVAIHW